jgi:hypothetical protein
VVAVVLAFAVCSIGIVARQPWVIGGDYLSDRRSARPVHDRTAGFSNRRFGKRASAVRMLLGRGSDAFLHLFGRGCQPQVSTEVIAGWKYLLRLDKKCLRGISDTYLGEVVRKLLTG